MEKKGYEGQIQTALMLLISGVVFLMVSFLVLFYLIPYTIKGSSEITNMANDCSLFPTIYALAVLLISCVFIGLGIRQLIRNRAYLTAANIRTELRHLFLFDSAPMVVFALFGVLFCVLATRLGFFSSCWLVTFLATAYLKNRGIIWLGVFPAAVTAVIWLVFDVLLSVRFPSGLLF